MTESNERILRIIIHSLLHWSISLFFHEMCHFIIIINNMHDVSTNIWSAVVLRYDQTMLIHIQNRSIRLL